MTKLQQKKQLDKEIKNITSQLVKKYRPEKIILFGSVARGEENLESDIDLLLIKKSLVKRGFRTSEVFKALRGTERNYPLDPLVYTPQELEKRLAIGDYFIKRILNEGRILYSKKSFAYG